MIAWAAFFGLAVAFLGLRYWLLPNIERYHDDIVGAVSRSMGMPVKIGAIEADWLWLHPRLSLTDVRVYDREGREALVLPSLENVLAWESLLAGELRLYTLIIDRPRLTVRRDAAGALYVAGIKLESGGGEGGAAAWILAQREVAIRDGEIEWLDERRGAPPLVLSAVNLRLRNAADGHSIGLSALPPANLGASLDVRVQLSDALVAQPSAWRGRVYAELGDTDLAAWRAWFDYPVDLQAGRGALRLWADIAHGAPQRVTADLALSDARVQFAPELPPLELSRVGGRLVARVTERGYDVAAHDFAFETKQGPRLQPTHFGVMWERAAPGAAEHGAASASLIEIEPLLSLAQYVPLPEGFRQRLAAFGLKGLLRNARFEWQGKLAQVQHFAVKASFDGLGMNPSGKLPGFAGMSGGIDASEARGTLTLASSDAAVDLPRVFPDPRIAFSSLNGQLEWQLPGDGGVQLRVARLAFANEQLAGSASGSYAYSADGPQTIDLSAQVSRADAKHIGKYLPLASIMGEATRKWLERSVLAAELSDAQLQIKGDLRDFPYRDASQGLFRVSARMNGGVLDFASGWPRIEGIDGDLLFDGARMEILARHATTLGARLAGVRATIPDLLDGAPRLEIAGDAEGDSARFLRYIQASPVRGMISGVTDRMRASGNGQLKLRLDLLLAHLAASKVAGEYRFEGNSVSLVPGLPQIARASGRLSFGEAGFTLHEAKGTVLGGSVTASGASRGKQGLRIAVRGDATADGVRAALPAEWRGRLGEALSGAFGYSASVTGRTGELRVTVSSSLAGLACNLPAPLNKTTSQSVPLRVSLLRQERRVSALVKLGTRVAASFRLGGEGDKLALQRAAIAIGPAASRAAVHMPKSGVLVYGALRRLDLDRWRALLPERGKPELAVQVTVDKLAIAELDAYGKRLHNLLLGASTIPGGVELTFGAADPRKPTEIRGSLSYVKHEQAKIAGNLDYLRIPDDTPGARGKKESLTELPDLDLAVAEFEAAGKQFGKAGVRAHNEGWIWHIDSLSIANPDGTLTGSGSWSREDLPATSVQFKIDAANSGKLLERMGYRDLLRGGTANLAGTLTWTGEPFKIDFPSLAGELKLEAKNGQFLKVDPGAGKLISLLSLQALPRRLTGDFGDVFQKGFQYQNISSTLQIKQGVGRTDNLRVSGSAAEVVMTGSVDFVREGQDMRVRVVPNVGDTTCTLLLLLSPHVGIPSCLFQLFVNPVGRVVASEYAVTGTWSDPKVEKVSTTVVPPKPPAQ
jgi:uncharacterized protein (TIGR02099 family)